MENKGIINTFIPFSSVDGPGNRSVIFMQGCNFNCLNCHNPQTIKLCNSCGACIANCPVASLTKKTEKIAWEPSLCVGCDTCLKTCSFNSSPKTREMTVEEVIAEIAKSKRFISGITVSGGECTLQKDFLVDLFKEIKKTNLTIFIDTNGSIPLWQEESFVNLFDMAMVDLKSIDSQEHIMLTGMDNKTVIENIRYLAGINKLYEVRTVIIPQLLDNQRNVDGISKLLASLDSNVRYKLIKYRQHGVREHLLRAPEVSQEELSQLKKLAEKNGCQNVVAI